MKRVDSRRPEAAQSQRERVTAGEAVRTSPPAPSAPEKTVAQATRRMTALEERMSHLEDALNELLAELKGELHDDPPTLE